MKNICVYCGSNAGNGNAYLESARELGQALADRDIGLVYGGARVGLMGALADSVLTAGGRVIGVMPQALVDKEVAHEGLTELKIVDSMHTRKSQMVELADGFIALPGGLGTLEEIFETLTWAQLGFHQKPCALLNVKNYYDQLAAFLDHAVSERFLKSCYRDNLMVEDSIPALLDRMLDYTPPAVTEKWIGRDDT